MEKPPRSCICKDGIEAGLNRARKLLKQHNAKAVYLALDADDSLIEEITGLCRENGIFPDRGHTKAELGALCALEVGCAVCVVPKLMQDQA